MTIVSNDPIWWPLISSNMFLSYWSVAASALVVHDWALNLGQEIELIWCDTIFHHTAYMLMVLLTDAGHSYTGNIFDYTSNGTYVVIPAVLGVIMIVRLHAMFQRSGIMLVFLVIMFLLVNIACRVIMMIILGNSVGDHGSLDKHQRSRYFLGHICANLNMEGMSSF
ncbi:hypothetical protein BD769DRAFT_1396791 [Suillus cothurnatus]|nr:hypothetical protein BD769DRAFT_1396791 [Suillus cothurnatus]